MNVAKDGLPRWPFGRREQNVSTGLGRGLGRALDSALVWTSAENEDMLRYRTLAMFSCEVLYGLMIVFTILHRILVETFRSLTTVVVFVN